MNDNQYCECPVQGFCKRYNRAMLGRPWEICQGKILTPEKCQQYRANWLLLADYNVAINQPLDEQALLAGPEYWPCIHRGKEIGDHKCEFCSMSNRIEKIYECAVHGSCTLRKYRNENQPEMNCNGCDSRRIPEDNV